MMNNNRQREHVHVQGIAEDFLFSGWVVYTIGPSKCQSFW